VTRGPRLREFRGNSWGYQWRHLRKPPQDPDWEIVGKRVEANCGRKETFKKDYYVKNYRRGGDRNK